MSRDGFRKSVISALLLLAGGAYVYLSSTAPERPTAPGFEIYEPWKTLIRVTFTIPFLLSWAFGAFAAEYLMTAARQAPKPETSRLFRLLGYGVLFLVVGTWFSTLISQISINFFPRGSASSIAATVAQNYAYVIFPLVGSAFIYRASTVRGAKERRAERNWSTASLLIAILGALWLAIIFTNESRQVSSLAFGQPTYYINDALIILTIVTPTLIAWLLGITGALNFSALESGGSPANRRVFTWIVHGLVLAVFNSMILNGLLSAGTERLVSAGLGLLIAIVYVFVFLSVLSYWMIYRGAKTLLSVPYEHQE